MDFFKRFRQQVESPEQYDSPFEMGPDSWEKIRIFGGAVLDQNGDMHYFAPRDKGHHEKCATRNELADQNGRTQEAYIRLKTGKQVELHYRSDHADRYRTRKEIIEGEVTQAQIDKLTELGVPLKKLLIEY